MCCLSWVVLIKLFECEIDFELRDFFNHYLSKAYTILSICGFKPYSNSSQTDSQNLTYLELEH